MKFTFKAFGKRVSVCTHGKKEEVFNGRHYHWSGRIQNWLWKRGLSVHNFIIGECTQDFSCCCWRDNKYAGFFEQLVAVAKDTQEGKHSGVIHITKGKA
jgi:hypothetical protein